MSDFLFNLGMLDNLQQAIVGYPNAVEQHNAETGQQRTAAADGIAADFPARQFRRNLSIVRGNINSPSIFS